MQLCLNSVFKGKGTTAFISGEAGSGKTRLANEFLNAAREKQVTVLSGWCLSNATVPFFPFAEAFDSYLSSNEAENNTFVSQRTSMKSWLIEPSQNGGTQKPNAQGPQAWKDQTFAAVAKDLLLMSNSRPTILFIDDIHWADSASLALLHYIARTIDSERILLLATFRSEETLARPEGQTHPLAETLRLMAREGLFREVKLLNLNQSDVGKIAKSMLGGNTKTELIKKLAEESQGNPLFVVESLRMLHEQGNLVKEQGEWSSSVENLIIPAKVKSVILRRLDSLKPSQRRTLDAASILGEKFDPKLVAAAVSGDIIDILDALNSIEQSARLVHCNGNYYWFDHAKTREMLYDEIPPLLRKEYHSRIAQKIETLSQDNKKLPASDLAYHYIQAENEEKATKYSILAGKDALRRFSNAEAIKHFTHAVQSTGESTENINERIIALEGLGDALQANNMFKEARKTFELLSSIGTGVVKLRAFRKAMEAAFFQGDLAHLKELLEKAEEHSALDRLERARIRMNRARVLNMQGMWARAQEDFEWALQVFEEEYSLWDTAWILIPMGVYSAFLGQFEKGLANSLRSIAMFSELEDSHWLMEAYLIGGRTCLCCGLMPEALEMFAEAVKIDDKKNMRDYDMLAQVYVEWARVLEVQHDLERALSMSLKALECSEKTDSLRVKGPVYATLAMQYTKLGDMERAEKYFNKFIELPPEVLSYWPMYRILTKPVFLAGKNRWEESNQSFKENFEIAKALGPPSESVLKTFHAWALAKQGRVEEAKKQVEEAQKSYHEIEKRFDHVNVQASLMAPKEVSIGQISDARLDIVNTSKKQGIIVSVKDLTLPGLKISVYPQEFVFAKDSINMKEKVIHPFQVTTIKLKLQATKTGVYNLIPKVIYIDDLGKNQESKSRQVTITVKPTPAKAEKEDVLVTNLPNQASNELVEPQSSAPDPIGSIGKFEFATDTAQKTFDYLISAFVQDYMRRSLALEKAGWRTLMEIIKGAKIPVRSVYGEGRRGLALAELERRGLVEARIFPGERGRGGRILKARILYDKEPIKRHIDHYVTKNA